MFLSNGDTSKVYNNTLVTGESNTGQLAIMLRADTGVCHPVLVNNLFASYNSDHCYTSMYHMNNGSTNYPSAVTTNLYYVEPTTGADGEYMYYGGSNSYNVNALNFPTRTVPIYGGTAQVLTSTAAGWNNKVNVDPQLIDPEIGEFHIGGSSPALGAGTDLSQYFTTDRDGYTRSVPWSIGAYD